MRLYNTLSRKVEDFKPLHKSNVRLYSCGPTVYDHAHIGNLSSYIFADTLRRVLAAAGNKVEHVMNFTDVDDKTIRRSAERYPDLSREEALAKLTGEYEKIFLDDMKVIGNDVAAIKFVSATESIEGMRALIRELFDDGFAYIAEDGIYFSIEKYRASGKKYGQLTEITAENTGSARINNDEYDKENVHDFALWKIRKDNEPAWELEIDGKDLTGRPGWHIECSVMSVNNLGQPFDIHTGGVDLKFPHHENEIAQSTAGKGADYAKFFAHNEHLLVNGKKMAKSAQNFYTLQDVREHNFDPLAFRLLVLQSHYRTQSNFSWANLEAAQNRLNDFRALADLQFQPIEPEGESWLAHNLDITNMLSSVQDDLNTPEALAALSKFADSAESKLISNAELNSFIDALEKIDSVFGLDLTERLDISDQQKDMLDNRSKARKEKDWQASDRIRDDLSSQGILVRDTSRGQIWSRA